MGSKRTSRALFPAACLLLVASTALADGGTLELRTRLPEGVYSIWPPENFILEDPSHATMHLDQENAEDVLVFTTRADPPTRLVFSKSKPYRLFVDLNGDGRCQAKEIYFTSWKLERSFWHGQVAFEDVSLPLEVDGRKTTLLTNIGRYFRRRHFYSLSKMYAAVALPVNSYYEGTLALGDVESPARLGFRSPFPDGRLVNEVIILDSSPDGSFEADTDLWFSGNGVTWLMDRFCAVETVFSGSEAQVFIEPYSGPTGNLKVEGEGYIERLSLTITPPGTSTEAAPGPAYEMVLPHQESRLYRLPVGECAPGTFLLLKPDKDSRVHFDCLPGKDSPVTAKVSADTTASLLLAGPLTGKANPEVLLLRGEVALGYDCLNPAGLRYRAIWREDYRPPGPLYRVLNRQGEELASGRFEYG